MTTLTEQLEIKEGFPRGGYPNLMLEDVFRVHGPIQGLTELSRRAGNSIPPRQTILAEVAVEAMLKAGQLSPLSAVDYVALDH